MPENNHSVRGESGSINISEEVIASIASLAAGEVQGVSGFYTPSGVDLAEFLGRKSASTKGVKMQIVGRNVTLELYINIFYGYKIPEVATKLQEAVANAVESMTGLQVDSVNVHVGSILFEAKTEEI